MRLSVFSIVSLLLVPFCRSAQASCRAAAVDTVLAGAAPVTGGVPASEPSDTVVGPSGAVECGAVGVEAADTASFTRYDRRVYRYRRLWNFLIPTQIVTQFAGNMGMISAGVGWDYGCHRQYETALLVGYLPKFHSSRAKMTMTVKQNFVPWKLPVGRYFNVEPLSFGLYVNTVFGSEFWHKQPKRYPDKYYPFLSTKARINVFVGQRFTAIAPSNRRKFVKSVTAFYEVSTCDLYIRAMIQDRNVSLWDIIGLSLGLKMQVL